MKKMIPHILTLSIGFVFGASISFVVAQENSQASSEKTKLAYLIVSADRVPGVSDEDYAPYREAAGPLAQAAGINVVAPSQKPLVLEGSWPHENVTIETFTSMDELKKFWYSDGYQTAKKLREGLSKINFIMAVEGS